MFPERVKKSLKSLKMENFMGELKKISDQVAKITCTTPEQKNLLNNQLMFLAISINTKKEFIETILNFYKSKNLQNFVIEIEKIKI